MKRALLVFGLALLGLGLAVDYRTDAEGGPDNLAEAVRAAFAAWQALEPALEANEVEDAATLIRYGGAERFGPDALTLTVQRQDAEGGLTVLVNPTSRPELETALLHETGLLLGLSPSAAGVLNPAIGEPLELGEVERAELEAVAAFIPEDLDRSGTVDFYDLLLLAQSFGQQGVNLPGDLSGDGLVDRADLELLQAAYTFAPPSATPPTEPEAPEDLPAELPEAPKPSEEGAGEDEEPTPPADEDEDEGENDTDGE